MDREGDRLAEVLERLANRPMMQAPPQFKVPQYTGQGDIEYFISRFKEIAEANGWRPVATLLHLGDSLRDSAEDCGCVCSHRTSSVRSSPSQVWANTSRSEVPPKCFEKRKLTPGFCI